MSEIDEGQEQDRSRLQTAGLALGQNVNAIFPGFLLGEILDWLWKKSYGKVTEGGREDAARTAYEEQAEKIKMAREEYTPHLESMGYGPEKITRTLDAQLPLLNYTEDDVQSAAAMGRDSSNKYSTDFYSKSLGFKDPNKILSNFVGDDIEGDRKFLADADLKAIESDHNIIEENNKHVNRVREKNIEAGQGLFGDMHEGFLEKFLIGRDESAPWTGGRNFTGDFYGGMEHFFGPLKNQFPVSPSAPVPFQPKKSVPRPDPRNFVRD